ncbi:MAG: hypothetical protein WDM76_03455 [Limisphaerales bacterium]
MNTISTNASHWRNNTQYGRNDRDSVVTAPRFVNANTGTAIRREFQSRDQVDTALANQTDLKIDFSTGPIEHTLVPGMEFVRETSVNYARAVQTNGVFITGTALNSPNADLFNPDPNVLTLRAGRPHRREDGRDVALGGVLCV